MSWEFLISQFDRVADAPEAVPRLRGFILDLAVRGKLASRSSDDEPASERLKRLQAEKVRVSKGKAQHVEPVGPGEAPFELPATWAWARLGEVCSKTGSGSTPRGGQSVYKEEGVPFLRSQNIYDDGLRLEDVAYIDKQTHRRMNGTAVKHGDLLLNITGGSIGRCCRVPDDFRDANVSQHVAIIRVAIRGMEELMQLVIQSPYFQSLILDRQTGAGRGGLPKNRMDRLPVAIAPLGEQCRIVAKVREMMTLCDRLAEAQVVRDRRRDQLLEVLLYQALDAKS